MSENAQVTTSQWLGLNKNTKDKLREVFFIPKSGVVEVVVNEFGKSTIMSDGTTHKDLATITIEKMRDFIGQELTTLEETFNSLFEKVVTKIETPVVEMVAPVVVVADIPVCKPTEPCTETKIEEPVVDKVRTVECKYCKKNIKSKDVKYDARLMKMHVNKYHKEHKI